MWCLGSSVTTAKGSVFEEGKGDLGNYGLVRLFSVTGDITEGVHWSLSKHMKDKKVNWEW